ncbi:MAG: hypothetical protein KR126chlam1_01527 [Chlamydiae bacterium]|nr:hypothetical protein [Chlamydiota bacterium]
MNTIASYATSGLSYLQDTPALIQRVYNSLTGDYLGPTLLIVHNVGLVALYYNGSQDVATPAKCLVCLIRKAENYISNKVFNYKKTSAAIILASAYLSPNWTMELCSRSLVFVASSCFRESMLRCARDSCLPSLTDISITSLAYGESCLLAGLLDRSTLFSHSMLGLGMIAQLGVWGHIIGRDIFNRNASLAT